MSSPLDGPAAKLHRAEQHLTELESSIRDGRDKTYGVFEERDPAAPGERVYRYRMPRELRCQWGLIAGDVLYNIRGSLNLLAWQLVADANEGRVPVAYVKTVQFPIVTAALRDGVNLNGMLTGMTRARRCVSGHCSRAPLRIAGSRPIIHWVIWRSSTIGTSIG